jgi:ComF family protein
MLNKIIKLIYPDTCGFCDKILNNEYTCEDCRLLYTINTKTCDICGKEVEEISNRCLGCLHKHVHYSKLVYAFNYKDIVRKRIIEYKFRNKKYLFRCFAENLSKKLVQLNIKFDIIIPVPIHRKRLRKRGYNQSYLIAKEVSKILNNKLVYNLLFKIKNTVPQRILNEKQRRQNVKQAYAVKDNQKIKNKVILLIDDIFTTGATVDECSKKLREAGAKDVIVATIAR